MHLCSDKPVFVRREIRSAALDKAVPIPKSARLFSIYWLMLGQCFLLIFGLVQVDYVQLSQPVTVLFGYSIRSDSLAFCLSGGCRKASQRQPVISGDGEYTAFEWQ